MGRIVVVGGGFGGLATAIRAQAAGHQVTLVERRSRVGGRAYQFQEAGYTFDMGPTIMTAPELLAELWAVAGEDYRSDVTLHPLHPCYDLVFRGGGRLAYWSNDADMAAEIERFAPGEGTGYRRLMQDTGRLYQRAFEELGRQPFDSLVGFIKVAPDLLRMGGWMSVYQYVSRYLRDDRLRAAFSFHPLFIGGNPFRASALFSIIPYLEQRGGVWFVQGGTYALVAAMERLFRRLGGEVQCGDGVAQVLVGGGRARGVGLDSGCILPADAVVSNADVATTYSRLVPPAARRRYTDRHLRGMSYSMSCYVLYLGLDRQYPHLRHHTVVMPRDYRGAVNAIFGGTLREDDLALYLHLPTRTDPTLAPTGGDTLYALVPVPNLLGGLQWPEAGEALREHALNILEQELGMTDLRRHIVVERQFTPLEFQRDLASYAGAAFSFEPTLLQAGYFRPHNRSEDVAGLYLTGAGTHPGAGVPGVLMSAEVTANQVLADLPAPARRTVAAATTGVA